MQRDKKLSLSRPWILPLLLILGMSACYRPPYNQFEPQQGARARFKAEPTIEPVLGAAGGLLGALQESKGNIIENLRKHDIQMVQYGETITLIVPTDKYYMFNSAKFHELQYPGLETILNMLKLYPHRHITVAAFSDSIGSRHDQDKMTDARAHTMVAFLWANGIPSSHLRAEGYGACYPIGDNHLIHGSAHNRRLEIQWTVNQVVHT